jgi:hypothetical protein
MKWLLLFVTVLFVSSCYTQRIKYIADENGLEKDIFEINDILFSDTIMLNYFHIDSVAENTFFVDDKIRYGFHYFYYNHAQYRMAKNNDSDFVSVCMQMEKEKEEYMKQNEAIKISSNNNLTTKNNAKIELLYWYDRKDQVYTVEFIKIKHVPSHTKGYVFLIQRSNEGFDIVSRSTWTE